MPDGDESLVCLRTHRDVHTGHFQQQQTVLLPIGLLMYMYVSMLNNLSH